MYDHAVQNSMVQERGGRERERKGGRRGLDLSCSVRTFSVMCDHTFENSMVQERGGREREREREGGGRWVDLGGLMTPGLSKDIRCHVWP